MELGATIGVRILGAKNRALNFSNAHLHDEVHRLVADLGGSIINDATVVALGVPLGSDPALVQRLALNEIKADNFFRVLALPSMPSDVHDTVLRVAGLPRGNYLTRVGYPGEYSQALDYFDGQMESHAAISLGMSLDALRRSPLTLASARSPIRSAGLGYLALADISPFALWGALANAAPGLTRVFQQHLPPILERAAQTALTAIRDQLDTDPVASRTCGNAWHIIVTLAPGSSWSIYRGTYDARRSREPSASGASQPLPFTVRPSHVPWRRALLLY